MRKIFFTIIILFFISCEKNSDSLSNDNSPLLKSVEVKTNSNLYNNRNQYFNYENEKLSIVSGYSHISGTIKYDKDKPIELNRGYIRKIYKYNIENKLNKIIKIEEQRRDTILIKYIDNKIIVENNWNIIELTFDENKRISKKIEYLSKEGKEPRNTKKFEYDSEGNIISITNLDHTYNKTNVYQYEYYLNVKNPYFSTFKDFYKHTLIDQFISGPYVYNSYGITPNLIKDTNYKMELSENNFPENLSFYSSGYQVTFEYKYQ